MEPLVSSYGINSYFSHCVFDNALEAHSVSHSHNRIEMLLFLDGDARFLIEDRQYSLEKYDLVFIRPMKMHHIIFNTNARYERYYLLFDKVLVENALPHISEDIEVFNVKDDPTIPERFRCIDRYVSRFPQQTYIFLIEHLIQEIVWNLSLLNPKLRQRSSSNPFIESTLRYMEEHFHSDLTIKGICQAFYVNQNYLTKVFKEHMAITPKQYLLQKRLRFAQDLILQGMAPMLAAAESGYRNYNTFYKAYLKMFGYAPSDLKSSKEREVLSEEFS